MKRRFTDATPAGDERIIWRPSSLLIAISVFAWMAMTILLVRDGFGHKGATWQLQAWDPDGLDYQVEVQIGVWGFEGRDGFKVVRTDCKMRCQVFHREDHTVETEVQIITRFMGNRQVVLERPDGQKTLTLEWGYRDSYPGYEPPNRWDSAGRFIDLDYQGNESWARALEPGSFQHYSRISSLLGWSLLMALVPILFGWLAIYLAVAFMKDSRMRHRDVKCPVCGYDLHGQVRKGCPECGWNRD